MYWNRGPSLTSPSVVTLNSNIRCIEISEKHGEYAAYSQLNSNIRCIEMTEIFLQRQLLSRWIVTLDVLKYKYNDGRKKRGTLNSNIRCIEIKNRTNAAKNKIVLNSNIRCIEIGTQAAVRKLLDMLNSNIRCIEMLSEYD